MQWAHLGDYFIGCPLISSMPLWILFANMCPLYLIVQGQQIYVAKLRKQTQPKYLPQLQTLTKVIWNSVVFTAP